MTTFVGGYVLAKTPIEINVGRPRTTLLVRNTGDRPIQVGSHFHFFEVNRALELDRLAAFGLHLDIAAGTAIRFEPGDQREVTPVPFGGKQRLYGRAPTRPSRKGAPALAGPSGERQWQDNNHLAPRVRESVSTHGR